MADLRLLTGVAAASLIAPLVAGCAIGLVWAPQVDGRVLEKETGAPIEGAEVFVDCNTNPLPIVGWGASVWRFDFRWATTPLTPPLYDALGLFNDYRVRSHDPPKALSP